jgi:GNAT superfamily N-acetyltransferase
MNAVNKFLKAHAGRTEFDLSDDKLVFDKWGGVKIKVYEQCTISLLNDANEALGIGNIEVEPNFRSNGIGSKVMKLLIDYADANQVVLTLYPRSHSRSPLSSSELEKWYEGMGFIKTPRGHIRKANQGATDNE